MIRGPQYTKLKALLDNFRDQIRAIEPERFEIVYPDIVRALERTLDREVRRMP